MNYPSKESLKEDPFGTFLTVAFAVLFIFLVLSLHPAIMGLIYITWLLVKEK